MGEIGLLRDEVAHSNPISSPPVQLNDGEHSLKAACQRAHALDKMVRILRTDSPSLLSAYYFKELYLVERNCFVNHRTLRVEEQEQAGKADDYRPCISSISAVDEVILDQVMRIPERCLTRNHESVEDLDTPVKQDLIICLGGQLPDSVNCQGMPLFVFEEISDAQFNMPKIIKFDRCFVVLRRSLLDKRLTPHNHYFDYEDHERERDRRWYINQLQALENLIVQLQVDVPKGVVVLVQVDCIAALQIRYQFPLELDDREQVFNLDTIRDLCNKYENLIHFYNYIYGLKGEVTNLALIHKNLDSFLGDCFSMNKRQLKMHCEALTTVWANFGDVQTVKTKLRNMGLTEITSTPLTATDEVNWDDELEKALGGNKTSIRQSRRPPEDIDAALNVLPDDANQLEWNNDFSTVMGDSARHALRSFTGTEPVYHDLFEDSVESPKRIRLEEPPCPPFLHAPTLAPSETYIESQKPVRAYTSSPPPPPPTPPPPPPPPPPREYFCAPMRPSGSSYEKHQPYNMHSNNYNNNQPTRKSLPYHRRNNEHVRKSNPYKRRHESRAANRAHSHYPHPGVEYVFRRPAEYGAPASSHYHHSYDDNTRFYIPQVQTSDQRPRSPSMNCGVAGSSGFYNEPICNPIPPPPPPTMPQPPSHVLYDPYRYGNEQVSYVFQPAFVMGHNQAFVQAYSQNMCEQVTSWRYPVQQPGFPPPQHHYDRRY